MKKLLMILLSLAVMASVYGCASKEASSEEETENVSEETVEETEGEKKEYSEDEVEYIHVEDDIWEAIEDTVKENSEIFVDSEQDASNGGYILTVTDFTKAIELIDSAVGSTDSEDEGTAEESTVSDDAEVQIESSEDLG